jgi:transposase
MIERSGEFPEDVGELKALTRATVARANRFEAESEAARGEVLKLKAEVNDLAEAHATAKTEIARLTSILKTLRRGRFGKRSEKLSPDEDEQQSFVFEELETGLEAIERRLVAKTGAKPRNTSPAKPRFPSHLERVEEVLEPEIPPGFEGQERVKIGQDESVRLDVVRARFRLIVTIRPKYAFKEPEKILQAPAPEHIVEAGLPTEALLAQVAVSKYADGLPLYRQEAIYARDGVELGRSLMAQWMGAVGFHFEPLAAHVLSRIREGERIFADETTLPTLNPGAGKTKTAWFGPTRATTGRSAARDRRWSPTGSRKVDRAIAQRATWATIAASSNATVMPDIARSPAAPIPMECGLLDVGPICGASSSTYTPTASRLSRRRRSTR